VTSASYRVVMSTKGGPPWTPFTLTVTASPGLVASGARGQRALPGSTALAAARESGVFTGEHESFWAATFSSGWAPRRLRRATG
jgi:hypothetical protein